MADHYDVIIVGTGAGGGTQAYALARAGKRILVLDRGPFLPREKENWDTVAVFLRNRYHTTDVWTDKHGKDIHPGTGYWVGGNTKVYGAAMFRLRERDFGVLQHEGGVSPEWLVKYDEFEPHYAAAERLFDVHGQAGLDPTEPWRSSPYPFPPLPNEHRMQTISDAVAAQGLHPYPVPLGLRRDSADPLRSPCIRCDTCDGFPCLVHAKADADVNCVRPVMDLPNVTLKTGARVLKVNTNPTGTEATGVTVELANEAAPATFTADVVVVAAGAINSAALLLASATDAHPTGLGNRSSDMVGRHFMFHNSNAMLAISTHRNDDRYMKTWGVNDFYFGGPGYAYPMGSVQPVGSFRPEMMRPEATFLAPEFVLDVAAAHAVPWWLMTEDLPDPDNRVTLVDGKVRLTYTPNNQTSFNKLTATWIATLKKAGHATTTMGLSAYLKQTIPIEGVGHQNGTCRFGDDPKTSVLDRDCQCHDVKNLYVVDGSFFPSCGAVNPSLTIIANALRVGEHLIGKMH
jgi:choline dehydrogenase-like flavoprotein